jgi:hypothetical protein
LSLRGKKRGIRNKHFGRDWFLAHRSLARTSSTRLLLARVHLHEFVWLPSACSQDKEGWRFKKKKTRKDGDWLGVYISQVCTTYLLTHAAQHRPGSVERKDGDWLDSLYARLPSQSAQPTYSHSHAAQQQPGSVQTQVPTDAVPGRYDLPITPFVTNDPHHQLKKNTTPIINGSKFATSFHPTAEV